MALALAHLCWVHCLDHPKGPTITQQNVQGLDRSMHNQFWCLILGFLKSWDGWLFVGSTCGFASGID
jgi:hypothetical protein